MNDRCGFLLGTITESGLRSTLAHNSYPQNSLVPTRGLALSEENIGRQFFRYFMSIFDFFCEVEGPQTFEFDTQRLTFLRRSIY
jgi:hypothetical protein